MSEKRHFLTLMDFSPSELTALLHRAIEMKSERDAGIDQRSLPGTVMGMIFEKSSTRTRVSFESGMAQMGGHALFLSSTDTQLGRGEPVEDSAKVISSMVDIVMIRTSAHGIVERFAANSSVPVINALSNDYHPCQLLADMQTWLEQRGSIAGKPHAGWAMATICASRISMRRANSTSSCASRAPPASNPMRS